MKSAFLLTLILLHAATPKVHAQVSADFYPKLKIAVEAKINQLRSDKKLAPIAGDPVLTQAAQHHSNYQRTNNVLTHDEKTPGYLTPSSRVSKFGGSDFELVGENCLYISIPAEKLKLSKIDSIASVMARNWKDSPPHYKNILDKRYEFGSLGFAYDPTTEKLYATQVFGKKGIRVKNQLSANSFGLTRSEKGCMDQFTGFQNLVYNLGNGLTIFGREVVLSVSDKSLLERIWNSNKDGIAVDLVRKSQFPCGKENQLDFSPVYDGVLLQPKYKADVLNANYANSDYRYNGVIATIPEHLNPADYEPSILLIDEGKMCVYLFQVSVPRGNLDPLLYKPEIYDPHDVLFRTSGIIESKLIGFNFNSNDTVPTKWPGVPVSNHAIKRITVQTYASVDGDSAHNSRLQTGRAEVIKRYLSGKLKAPGYKFQLDSRENWDMMRYQLRYYGYGSLSGKSTTTIRAQYPEIADLPLKEMFANQRRSLACIEYEGTLTSDADSLQLAELNLRTGLDTDNESLVEKALALLYRQKRIPAFIFSEPYFTKLRTNRVYVQNFAALLTLDTEKYRHEIGRCINDWVTFYKGIRESGRRNMLYLYALANGDVLRIWDLDASRLKNILAPERLYPVREMTNIQNEVLLFDLHLTFIEYFGQINKSAEINGSFSYLMDYMDNGNLPIEKHIQLALFCNRWSRYDLSIARLKNCLDKNLFNAESLMILLRTATLYRNQLSAANYEKVLGLAKIHATRDLCNWISENFQVQREEALKAVKCELCGGK